MSQKRIIGIILIAVGGAVAYSGYELSNSAGNQLQSAFSGSPTDSVVVRYLLGAASAAAGVFLAR